MVCSSSLLARRRCSGYNGLPLLNCSKERDGAPVSTDDSSSGTPELFIQTNLDCKQGAEADLFKAFQCHSLSAQFEGLVKIGEGSCAVVYRAIDRREQREVAVKIMRARDEEHLQHAWNEYKVLQQISHPNIIKPVDFFSFPFGAVLVEDLFPGRSLERIVDDKGEMVESISRVLFFQLLDAVAHLHRHGVIHRDVKAQNILISDSITELCLVDFNASKLLSAGDALTMTGTPAYMPPEVLKGSSPSEASDVWASGLCLHYMLTGKLPSKDRSCVRLTGHKWEMTSDPCKEVLGLCLEPRRDLRPAASEILSKPWFEDD